MALQKTEAFVLRTNPFRSSSLVVTTFTRGFGKVKGVAKGVRGDVFVCPIALAGNEVDGLVRCGVNGTYLWHYPRPEGPAHYHHLPYVAKEFVKAYDAGVEVAPIEFDVEYDPKYEGGLI